MLASCARQHRTSSLTHAYLADARSLTHACLAFTFLSLSLCVRRFGAGLTLRLDWAWFKPKAQDTMSQWDTDMLYYLNEDLPRHLKNTHEIPTGVSCEFSEWTDDCNERNKTNKKYKAKQCMAVTDGSKYERWNRVFTADGELRYCCKHCFNSSRRRCACGVQIHRVYSTQCPECGLNYPLGTPNGAGAKLETDIGEQCAFGEWGGEHCLRVRGSTAERWYRAKVDGIEQACCEPCYLRSYTYCECGHRWAHVHGLLCPKCGKDSRHKPAKRRKQVGDVCEFGSQWGGEQCLGELTQDKWDDVKWRNKWMLLNCLDGSKRICCKICIERSRCRRGHRKLHYLVHGPCPTCSGG